MRNWGQILINIQVVYALLTSNLLVSTYAAVTTDKCGKTKFCVGQPDRCSPTDADCLFFSYALVSESLKTD